MKLRSERAEDKAAIRAVVEAAFGQPLEADLVDGLRHDGDAEISIVAETENGIVGHVLLSPMSAPVRALGLAPVSVAPVFQKQGIGSALIERALERARDHGWEAAFVLGEPDYYSRFGFSADAAAAFESPYAGPYFMAMELQSGALKGKSGPVAYAQAFSKLG